MLVWEEKLFEFGVGDVVGEGPGYASLAARSTSRTVCLEQCAIDSMVRWLYLEDSLNRRISQIVCHYETSN